MSAVNDVMTTDGVATAAIPFSVLHPTLPVASLTVTATSSNPSLVPDANLVLTNLGNGNWTITATPVGENIGSTLVTVLVADGTSFYAETFTFTVAAENDPPVHTVPGPQNVNVGSTLVFSTAGGNAISVSDVDAGSAAVETTLTAVGGTYFPGRRLFRHHLRDRRRHGRRRDDLYRHDFRNQLALDGLSFTPDAGFGGGGSLRI